MQFLGENGQNNRCVPPPLGLASILGNPGSVTVSAVVATY